MGNAVPSYPSLLQGLVHLCDGQFRDDKKERIEKRELSTILEADSPAINMMFQSVMPFYPPP